MEIGLSDAGLVVPRTSDYLTEIRDRYEALTGLTVEWDSDLVLGVLTAIMAQLLDQQAEALQAVYDAFSINAATGVQLSNLARLVGVQRKAATKGQVTLSLTGTPGTVITQGRQVAGGGTDGRARWVLVEDVTLDSAGEGTGIAQAAVAGRTLALAGEIDEIVTPVFGWDTVTNAEGASPGVDAESDDDLRRRRSESIQRSAGLGIGAIRAKVLELEYVESCSVIDNPDNEDKLVAGVLMLAHSYLVVVLPDTLTTEQVDGILEVLYNTTPVSVGHSASDEVGTVIGPSGFGKEVGFDYASEVEVDVVATIGMDAGYSAEDAKAALLRLVEAHFADLSIGDDVRQLPFAAMAASIPGIATATFTFDGVADLGIGAFERAVLGSWSAP